MGKKPKDLINDKLIVEIYNVIKNHIDSVNEELEEIGDAKFINKFRYVSKRYNYLKLKETTVKKNIAKEIIKIVSRLISQYKRNKKTIPSVNNLRENDFSKIPGFNESTSLVSREYFKNLLENYFIFTKYQHNLVRRLRLVEFYYRELHSICKEYKEFSITRLPLVIPPNNKVGVMYGCVCFTNKQIENLFNDFMKRNDIKF